MKVYIAARYSRKNEMARLADLLVENGLEVTSSWLREPFAPDTQLRDLSPKVNREMAENDVQDIDHADTFLFFSEDPLIGTPRGGRHAEFGYALGTGKRIVVIGGPENIFHYLRHILHYANVEDFLDTERITNEPASN